MKLIWLLSFIYFLHSKTLDILHLFCLLLISVLPLMLFINKMFLSFNIKIKFNMKDFKNKYLFFVKWQKGGKTKVKYGLPSLSNLFTL